MPSQIEDTILPLENLPERSVPPRKSYTAHFLSIDTETQELLDECDWDLYEINVEVGVIEAVKRYRNSSANPDPLFQVSVLTDPQRQITEISFETKLHASAKVRNRAAWFRKHNLHFLTEELESAGYNPNPAGFLYSDYYTILHRELKPLDKIDYDTTENVKAAEVWVETSLLRVVERVMSLNLFSELSDIEGIWLGVSSPHDWYDHVVKM